MLTYFLQSFITSYIFFQAVAIDFRICVYSNDKSVTAVWLTMKP